jgi:hypothetical protein
MTNSIAAQVAALPKKPTPELKQMWRELFDKEPPGFSRNYLICRLAYRIQELAYGGLKPAARAKLDALADALDPKAARQRVVDRPVVGTQLIREWRGVEHKVAVLADGFEWEGRRYKSLSAAARAITGTPVVRAAVLRPAQDGERRMSRAEIKRKVRCAVYTRKALRRARSRPSTASTPSARPAMPTSTASAMRAGSPSMTATTMAGAAAARWSARRCSG